MKVHEIGISYMFYIRNLQGTSFNTNRRFSRRLIRDEGSPSQKLANSKKGDKKRKQTKKQTEISEKKD